MSDTPEQQAYKVVQYYVNRAFEGREHITLILDDPIKGSRDAVSILKECFKLKYGSCYGVSINGTSRKDRSEVVIYTLWLEHDYSELCAELILQIVGSDSQLDREQTKLPEVREATSPPVSLAQWL